MVKVTTTDRTEIAITQEGKGDERGGWWEEGGGDEDGMKATSKAPWQRR
jgi:hypothetical protein